MWKRLAPVVFGCLMGAGALLCYVPVAADVPASDPTELEVVLATRRDAFLELEDGRQVARVDSRLSRRRGLVRLVVEVTAEGPAVDPLPGLEGVAGVNERTASEIDVLCRADAIAAAVVLASGRRLEGHVLPAKPERLPTRRLGLDGRIDYDARTKAYVAGFTVSVGPIPVGEHRLEVRARGEVRLVGTFHVDRTGGVLAGFAATGGLHRARIGE